MKNMELKLRELTSGNLITFIYDLLYVDGHAAFMMRKLAL